MAKRPEPSGPLQLASPASHAPRSPSCSSDRGRGRHPTTSLATPDERIRPPPPRRLGPLASHLPCLPPPLAISPYPLAHSLPLLQICLADVPCAVRRADRGHRCPCPSPTIPRASSYSAKSSSTTGPSQEPHSERGDLFFFLYSDERRRRIRPLRAFPEPTEHICRLTVSYTSPLSFCFHTRPERLGPPWPRRAPSLNSLQSP